MPLLGRSDCIFYVISTWSQRLWPSSRPKAVKSSTRVARSDYVRSTPSLLCSICSRFCSLFLAECTILINSLKGLRGRKSATAGEEIGQIGGGNRPCGGGNRPARQFLEAVDEHRSWIGQGRGAALKTSGTSKIRACASVLERTSPLPPFLFAKHLSFRDPELWFLTLTVPAEPTRRLRRMTCCARQGAPNCLFSVEGEGLTSECPSLRP